jgi:hypothetical protein
VVLTSTIASGDVMGGSSAWNWAASNGNLGSVPLGIGQETLTGSYTVNQVAREGQYQSQTTLDNTETIAFQSQVETESKGPGVISESMMLDDYGSAAEGVLCNTGIDELDADGANFTATAYCERVIYDTQFSTNGVKYQSAGGIYQADDVIPDTFTMAAFGTGNGMGTIGFRVSSMVGIGSTMELGYTNQVRENNFAGGKAFSLGKEVSWTSFRTTFDEPADEVAA